MTASKHFLNPRGAVYGCLWCLLTLNTQTLWTACLRRLISDDETFWKGGSKMDSVGWKVWMDIPGFYSSE